MAKIPTVFLEVRADTGSVVKNMGNAEKAFSRLRGSVKKGNKPFSKFASSQMGMAKGAIATAFSIGAITSALGNMVRDVATMQTLSIRLQTATGSAEKAKVKFKELTQIASKLPLSIEEATSSFVQLKNLGLDATERSLISFTNTASAMGKSLNQFVEAVADASTREFERLKEFGIKAKNEGDKIRFIFQGNETVVENTTDNIIGFLTKLGEVEFAGAAELQMDTITGATSNLKDELFKLNTAIMSGDTVQGVIQKLATNTSLIRENFEQYKFDAAINTQIKDLSRSLGDSADRATVLREVFSKLGESDLQGLEGRLVKMMIRRDKSKSKDGKEEIDFEVQILIEAYQKLQQAIIDADIAERAKEENNKKTAELKKKRASQDAANNHLEKIRLEDIIKGSKSLIVLNDTLAMLQTRQNEEFSKLISASKGNVISEKDLQEAASNYSSLGQQIGETEAAIEKLNEASEKFKEQMNQSLQDIKRGFADAIVDGENFKGVLKSILKELAKTGIIDAFGSFGSKEEKGSGIFGAIGKLFRGMASGGPISSNRSYIVGERGPELFSPSTAGNITPNHRMAGGGGRTINVVNNFDINGDRDEMQRLIAGTVSTSVSLAVSKIHDDKARGVT